jgi:hypothetical protein
MRTETDCTHCARPTPCSDVPITPSSRRTPAPNALRDAFLLEVRKLGDPDTAAQALLAAPGEVEPVERPNGTVARTYATHLDALALLLESIGYEALVLLGRLVERRVGQRQDIA